MSKPITFTSPTITKHRELTDAIKGNLNTSAAVTEGDRVTITETEEHGAYNANLPAGHTPESVQELKTYNTNFVKAAHAAVGEVSADVLTANKGVNKVEVGLGYFGKGDSLQFTADRSREYPNPKFKSPDAPDGTPEKITKSLVVTMTEEVKMPGVKPVRDAISSEFADRFAK